MEIHRTHGCMYGNWRLVIWTVRYAMPPHVELRVPAYCLLHPERVGFRRSIGGAPGVHYRLLLPDGSSVHVRLYKGYYYVHWDIRDPSVDPIGHLLHDAPHYLVIPALLGISAAISKAREVYSRNPRANFLQVFQASLGEFIKTATLTALALAMLDILLNSFEGDNGGFSPSGGRGLYG